MADDLKELRDRFDYSMNEWSDIRSEARIDMRYVSGDPWDAKDRQARQDAGRPVITCDEISQYANQAINNLRQNPRGIKINPAGNGSTDKTAELHQNLIRGIEYKSQAFRQAYVPGFENALQRSYGFWRVKRQYVEGKSFDQEIVIKGIQNPDSVVYDPDCKENDWSDAMDAFWTDIITKSEFKRRFPKATVVSFGEEQMKQAPGWVQSDHLQIADYWKANIKKRKLLLIDGGEKGPIVVFEDEAKLEGVKIIKSRMYDERTIVKQITNGLEILDEQEEPGTYIPIVPVLGKQMFVDDGGGAKRKILSLVRLARDPYMLYCYLCSQEAEEAGLTPKTPFIGYKGQFESDSEAWLTINKIPRPFVQVDPMVDGANNVLPLPQRQPFQPNFQAYEVAKESAKRSIQAAMGISPLPTAAQRQNEKSGIALKKIQEEQAIGSFHFIDNFDSALELTGRICEQYLPVVYDTEREVGIRKPDESHSVIRINTATPYQDHKGEQQHYPIATANHDVTVDVGPSYQSQRDSMDSFLDLLAQNQQVFPQIADLVVKAKNLGPIAEALIERLTPPQYAEANSPQQVMGQLQQAKQQVQQLHAYAQQIEGEKQKLMFEKQANILNNEQKLLIEKMKIDAEVAVAEITTKAQSLNERIKFVQDVWTELHGSAHEAEMQADQQNHEADQNQAAAANQSALQAQGAQEQQQNQAQTGV